VWGRGAGQYFWPTTTNSFDHGYKYKLNVTFAIILQIITCPVHEWDRAPWQHLHFPTHLLNYNPLLSCNLVLSRCKIIPKQVIQPPQLTNMGNTKIGPVHGAEPSPWLLCEWKGLFNASHSTRRTLIVRHKKSEVFSVHGGVGNVPFQGGQTSYSVSLIESECIIPNQLPIIVICRVHDTNSPGLHDDDFGCVQTLKLFKVPDGHDDLSRCVKEHLPNGPHCMKHTVDSSPSPFFRGQDLFTGGKV